MQMVQLLHQLIDSVQRVPKKFPFSMFSNAVHGFSRVPSASGNLAEAVSAHAVQQKGKKWLLFTCPHLVALSRVPLLTILVR